MTNSDGESNKNSANEKSVDDICARSLIEGLADNFSSPTDPHSPPIVLSSVWSCDDTGQADALLNGGLDGYVYQRDGHPNAVQFAAACKALHEAEEVAVTSSGMSAMALAMLSQLKQGDHILVSDQLYGGSTRLLTDEAQRLGITHTLVDMCNLDAVREAVTASTGLVVVETISNPLVRVVDIPALADISHDQGALLLVDNTFATPALCKPLTLGADLVLESVSKLMNGHSDVMLGMLAGRTSQWERVPTALSVWGLASSPLQCWLANRGLSTMHLRIRQCCDNAMAAAKFLCKQSRVKDVQYPGLEDHLDYEISQSVLTNGFGHVVTFQLEGGRDAVDQFIGAGSIPFCPSLGDVMTTMSHPCSTSHRSLTEEQLDSLGLSQGTIRLSIGTESTEYVINCIEAALNT